MATTMPVAERLNVTDDLRFVCDEMLSGLGRWLRIAGYDTAIAERGRRDRELVEQAHAQERILLTRDRRLVEIRRANDRTIVLECDGIDACAYELTQRLSLDWNRDPLSRCTLCNTRLELADHRFLDTLPLRIRTLGSTVNVCPRCGRLYWEGSHVRRMRTRLASFASHAAHREETQAAGELDRPDAPL
jgi:uncharacterized protein with PIN domain